MKFRLLIFGLLLFALQAQAQETKEEIQKKQQQLQREIDDLNSTLSKIKSSKKQSIGQLALVQKKIRTRQQLIGNINKQVRLLSDQIYFNTLEVNRMKKELDSLKRNYSQSLVFAYKNRSSYDYLNFIFSATSFNDAVKRVAYLRSYRQYRETQVNTITQTEQLIERKLTDLSDNKKLKSESLTDENKQLGVLEVDKKQQDQVLKQLKGQEKDIAGQIKTNQRNQQKLRSALQVIIQREIAEAKRKEAARLAAIKAEEDRKRKEAAALNGGSAGSTASATTGSKDVTTTKTTSTPATNPNAPNRTYNVFESTKEGLEESINFESRRGSLPWPVNSGYVSIHYGQYKIPGTGLVGNSDGVYINVPVGTSVKSVADGEVSAVFDIGGQTAVVVRHGKYFTAYNNLTSINVSRGSQVHAGTILGKAGTSDDGDGQILFMVTNGTGNLNPESWLGGR